VRSLRKEDGKEKGEKNKFRLSRKERKTSTLKITVPHGEGKIPRLMGTGEGIGKLLSRKKGMGRKKSGRGCSKNSLRKKTIRGFFMGGGGGGSGEKE